MNFFVATSGSAASHCEAQRLCFPFPEMQSSRIVPLASAPAGCAVPYSTTHDHCGALKGFSRNISKAALNLAPSVARALPLGDCAFPSFPHRLRLWFLGQCDHLRRPRCASLPIIVEVHCPKVLCACRRKHDDLARLHPKKKPLKRKITGKVTLRKGNVSIEQTSRRRRIGEIKTPTAQYAFAHWLGFPQQETIAVCQAA